MKAKKEITRLATEVARMRDEYHRLTERLLAIRQLIDDAGMRPIIWTTARQNREMKASNAGRDLFRELWSLDEQRRRLQWKILALTSRASRLTQS